MKFVFHYIRDVRLFIILIFILIIQLFYYFNILKFFQSLKNKRQDLKTINMLHLSGFIQKNMEENLKIENNILILDNTKGHAKNGIYSFVNRQNPIKVDEKFEIELQMKRKKGEMVSVNLVTLSGENIADWWTIQKAIEIRIRDDDLEIRSYDNRKDYDEKFYLNEMPKNGYIKLIINKNIISFINARRERIGEAIFNQNPLEHDQSILLGVAAYKESILEVSRFLISISEKK